MRFAAALIACSALYLSTLNASTPPLLCPGGTPLGRVALTVAPKTGGVPHPIETVNQLLPGDTISYQPLEIESFQKKKVRMALLLVPSDGSKNKVYEPKPDDEPTTRPDPYRA